MGKLVADHVVDRADEHAGKRADEQVRQRIAVRGLVQGVGFRPFVHRIATELGLTGWVRNDGQGVTLEIEGAPDVVAALHRRLRGEAPPLARIDAVDVIEAAEENGIGAGVRQPRTGFAIVASAGGRRATAIGPDSSVCLACLAELFDPGDRRHRYAFINCTHCGPRYTITRGLPYDRAQTSMAAFPQCPACLAEYRDPANRRFHAEPNACPHCGPTLALHDAAGRRQDGVDVIADTVRRLAAGEVVALKGLGGFHLACDARNGAAVARLRTAKAREEKPFALMVGSVASLARSVDISAAEAELLASPERPIVLLRKHGGAEVDAAFPGAAPGLAWLGAMLPYAPLHHLLFHEAAGRPSGVAWLAEAQHLALVMTSANPGGEPLVIANDEAFVRLAGIADAFVVHDRAIVTRCDDSVVRLAGGGHTGTRAAPQHPPQFVRRARGYTPRPIRLAADGPPVVAVGGHFKNTVCVVRGSEAFLSQHIGELDNAPTCVAHAEAIEHLVAILDVVPACVAHDLHPDYHSTRHAAELAERWGVPLVAVQHHHAHVAAIVAEHRIDGPVLGLALDGVGLGSDGAAWGGELLVVDGAAWRRVGHLAPLALPGGDRAAREPWRMAAAALARCGRRHEVLGRFAAEPGAAIVATMLERGLNCPPTTSLGRWFDAAAGLLGIANRMAFEGQAAMQLEGLAAAHGPVPADHRLYRLGTDGVLDFTPLVAKLADLADLSDLADRGGRSGRQTAGHGSPARTAAGRGAALFHSTVAAGLAAWVAAAAANERLTQVAAGGGCLLNAILADGLRRELAQHGLALFEARQAPPNDGGLALGQAWVARCTTN